VQTAQSVDVLIGACTLIGVAASVQQSWPVAINELVPNRDRGIVNVVMWVTATPFSVFSPVLARALVVHTSVGWRGCYYIATALTATTTMLFFFFYHPPTFELLHKGKRKSFMTILRMIDIGGTILMAGGLIVLLMGLSWGGQQ
jgi:MFS family permease